MGDTGGNTPPPPPKQPPVPGGEEGEEPEEPNKGGSETARPEFIVAEPAGGKTKPGQPEGEALWMSDPSIQNTDSTFLFRTRVDLELRGKSEQQQLEHLGEPERTPEQVERLRQLMDRLKKTVTRVMGDNYRDLASGGEGSPAPSAAEPPRPEPDDE
jgi:hypothetical protein